jgi:lauroyl/myristoyl acyltransferase
MIKDKSVEAEKNQGTDVSRFGLFGDLPSRAMFLALRMSPRMPYFIEAGLLYFFAFIVLILAHGQRRAIRKNLGVIWDDLSWAEGYLGVYRVFVNFGWTYIDGMRTRLGQKVVTWEIDSIPIFDAMRATPGAALILTTHTGNYDLAAALFSPKFGRDLHTVRAPERSPFLHEIRHKELERDTKRYTHFKVHYNSSDSLLGIELARLLMEGELVAIQSDRVIAEVSAVEVPLAGRRAKFRLPRGPLSLASLAKCPCYPLHVVRDRHRHYRIIFQDPLEVISARPGRPAREMDYAKAWVGSLMSFLEKHALQWFVFEEAFTE